MPAPSGINVSPHRTQPSGAQLEDLSSIKLKTKKMINTKERGK